VADAVRPSWSNSKASNENVENVENPPQNPVKSKSRHVTDISDFAAIPAKTPRSRQLVRFTAKVGHGKEIAQLRSQKDIPNLRTLPNPPPRKTHNTFITNFIGKVRNFRPFALQVSAVF
jgi:hypothetical protein